MSVVRHISDLHLGHKKILHFSPNRGGTNVDEHDEWIVKQWNSVVGKRDIVYVHGDVCFDMEKMPLFNRMNGKKRLIIGNHDKFDMGVYLKYFEQVHGFMKYKGYWLSHAPIHPDELRGGINIYGHVHNNPIKDPRYACVCVEQLDGKPIAFDEIKKRYPLLPKNKAGDSSDM